MEQAGHKHFSHAHNLIIHQLPEGIDVSCSGCNSPGNGTVYVCWQCNFFLHEQCYRAARSLKHPSHPHHPLTLVPYPTYLSNSFYCNSCETIGTGISYSCADCEFDLHVQCAYSISRTKSFYKTHHQFQQLVPSQDSYMQYQTSQVPSMAQNLDPFIAYQTSSQNPIPSMPQNESSVASNHIPVATSHYHPTNPVTSSQDLSIDMNSQKPVATLQYPSIDQTAPSVSIPNNYPPYRIPYNGPSVSVPMSSQYLSMNDPRPSSVSIPTNPPNPIPNNQDPSMPQKGPSHNPIPSSVPQTVSIPTDPIPNNQDPSMPQNGPYVTSSHNPIPSVPYPSMPQTVSISTNLIPNKQDPSMPQNVPYVTSSHNSIPSVPYPSMPQTVSIPTNPIPNNQDLLMPQNGPSVFIPDSSQNIIARAQFMTQNEQSVSIPAARPQEKEPSISVHPSSQNPKTSAQYPSMSQTEPSVSSSFQDPSMPQNGPYVPSSHNPIPSVPYPSMPQTVSIPTNPIPNNQDPLMPQNGPSVSIPDSSQNIIAGAQFETQTGQSVSIPTARPQEKEPSVSIHPSSQNCAQYPSMNQTGPSVSSGLQDPSMHQNEMKYKEIKHFSHSHNLFELNFQEDEENEAICSACEDTLVGKGYPCVKTDCDFLLHESCFHLKKEIQHKSHPEHPLTLLPLAPYNNKNGEFTCNACFSEGTGFTYNCSVCAFDLHIQCVSLPETVKRDDHEHVLKLFYSCPVGEYPVCDVCHGNIQKDRWVYYCESCDYGTHLGCVDCEECEGDSNLENSIHDAQAQLQRLQIQMEMSRQQAQFMASMGASLANLV